MSKFDNSIILESEKKASITEVLFLYLSYLPLFIVSNTLCVTFAFIYLRYQKAEFRNATSILVKADEKSGGSIRGSGGSDLIDAAMLGNSKRVNLENEIELLKSNMLMQKVVLKNKFNIQYYTVGRVVTTESHESELPFKVTITKVPNYGKTIVFGIKKLSQTGGIIYNKKNAEQKAFNWNEKINYFNLEVELSPLREIKSIQDAYECSWKPIEKAAAEISKELVVTSLNLKATIIKFNLVTHNSKRGASILDALVEEYKASNVDDKNKIANSTVEFINSRLEIISKDLGDVEANVMEQEIANPIFSQPAIAALKGTEFSKNSEAITDLSLKSYKANELYSYISQSSNNEKIVPSFLGIDDPILAALITEYNKSQLQLLSDLNTYASKSEVIEKQKLNLFELKSSIIRRTVEYRNELNIAISKLKSKDNELKSLFGTLPISKKAMKAIGRQGTIKEAIYLYLMQKREETLVTLASTTSNYSQIDKATVPVLPFKPEPKIIKLFAVVIGFLLPILFIYIKFLLNNKVTTREDITRKTQAPILGEIGHYKDTKALVVAHKSRSIIAEQFRNVRTNLQFVLGNNKIILITSSISGEGKSFVSLNIGAVLAITNKKVAILEFDLRKPRIVKNMGLVKKEMGISNYLAGQTENLEELFYTLDEYPNMHVYGCGPIPPNPSELMLANNMKKLFDNLKEKYDYVIVDSAPVGLVSDTFTINTFSDIVLYIVRQRYTLKNQIDYINDIYESKKLKSLGLIINDVKVGARYGYYGYGYGGGYGYGYGGGYGYGYGYGNKSGYFEKEPKTSFFGKLFKKN